MSWSWRYPACRHFVSMLSVGLVLRRKHLRKLIPLDHTALRGSVQPRFRQQSPALASLQPFLPAPFAAAWLKHYKTILNMVQSDFHTKDSVFYLLVHTWAFWAHFCQNIILVYKQWWAITLISPSWSPSNFSVQNSCTPMEFLSAHLETIHGPIKPLNTTMKCKY